MMRLRDFKDIDGDLLIIEFRKSAIFFEESTINKSLYHDYEFDEKTWNDLKQCLNEIAHFSWENFQPKEADSLGADYDSYWDKELDNEGNLTVRDRKMMFEKPDDNSPRLYKFNKRKMESLLYDLQMEPAK